MRVRVPRIVAVAVAAAFVAAGCGAPNNANEARPPSTLVLSAEIDDDKVSISPSGGAPGERGLAAPEVGAGLMEIAISNQSSSEVAFEVSGPVTEKTFPIKADGGSANMRIDLTPGDYDVRAVGDSSASPAKLTVGPARVSAKDELLLP
ncbi:MAG: hypothetical protein ACR2NA_08725 [Solirubrobacterales bacterium]